VISKNTEMNKIMKINLTTTATKGLGRTKV